MGIRFLYTDDVPKHRFAVGVESMMRDALGDPVYRKLLEKTRGVTALRNTRRQNVARESGACGAMTGAQLRRRLASPRRAVVKARGRTRITRPVRPRPAGD